MDVKFPDDIGECHALSRVLIDDVEALRQQNETLGQQVNESSRQLRQNSGNSSKPPSTDVFTTRKPALPRSSPKKRGGQKGHLGRTLSKSPSPDAVVDCRAGRCVCGADLSDQEQTVVERRQVFDLPAISLRVTEYRKHGCSCPACGRASQGVFPEDVPASLQYRPRISAMAVGLSVRHNMSLRKIGELLSTLYGAPIGKATLLAMIKRAHERLEASSAVIQQSIIDSEVVHFDESLARYDGERNWLHVASTAVWTYLFVHRHRGREALQSAESILPRFRGRAVHDCWGTYFLFTACEHRLCVGHLLRELQGLIEGGTRWGGLMHRFLMGLYHLTECGRGVLAPEKRDKAERLYTAIVEAAEAEEPPRRRMGRLGRPKGSSGRNLLDRLLKHRDAILGFIHEENTPFTNNQAERDIRIVKTKMKVAGCFRTDDGAQRHARIASFLSTAAKHGLNIFDALTDALQGRSFLTATSMG